MRLKAIGWRVIVKLKVSDIVAEYARAGLELTEDIKMKEAKGQQDAIIYDIGPTAFKTPGLAGTDLKIGDTVQVTKYSGEMRTDIEEGFIHMTTNDEDCLVQIIED